MGASDRLLSDAIDIDYWVNSRSRRTDDESGGRATSFNRVS
jgi:hypothetical protein